MTKALVTGSAGFIGHHLVKELLNREMEVIGLDNLSNGKQKNIQDNQGPRYQFHRADVRNKKDVKEAVEGCDVVFHLAAQSSVPKSTESINKDKEINLEGTINVLKRAKEQRAEVIFASTSTVYGTPKETPTPETHPLEPISFYGASKTSAEAYCSAMNGTHNLKTVSLRLYNVYGPRNTKGVMYDFFQKLNKDPSSLEILGTGKQTKDYIYIDDAINAFITAYKEAEGGEAYNVGSGETHSVNEIAKTTFKLMNINPEVTYTGGKGWKGDVEKTKAKITKLKELGWKPRTGFQEGIKKFYKWYKEEHKK